MPPFDAVHSLVNNWGMGVEDQIPQTWFDECNKPELKILEVGFGKGNLLKKFNTNGKTTGLYGLEASQTNYRYVLDQQKVIAQLAMGDISFERFQYPDGHFDVVILLEVLEHIMSPIHAILEIQRVLKKDGVFIFSWPEERLISGIGKELDQSKRQYGEGYHSFPYPGLFLYENMRVFFNQLYFKIIEETKNDYHIFFKMINKKLNKPNILDVVNGDYDGNDLYGSIKTTETIKI
jgi:SAM-dependent methyltransferase